MNPSASCWCVWSTVIPSLEQGFVWRSNLYLQGVHNSWCCEQWHMWGGVFLAFICVANWFGNLLVRIFFKLLPGGYPAFWSVLLCIEFSELYWVSVLSNLCEEVSRSISYQLEYKFRALLTAPWVHMPYSGIICVSDWTKCPGPAPVYVSITKTDLDFHGCLEKHPLHCGTSKGLLQLLPWRSPKP